MTPGRRCPAPDPHGAGSALPNAIPVPTSRPSGRGEVRGNFAQRRWAPNAARPAGSRRGYLLCAARPAARGGRRMNGPPGQRGVRQPRGSRVGGAARGPGPSLSARPAGPVHRRDAGGGVVRGAAVSAAASGGLSPARYARGHRRCLIFLRRETCSAPRPRAGHAHSRARLRPAPRPTPRLMPSWIPPPQPSAAALRASCSRLALQCAHRCWLRRRGRGRSLKAGAPSESVSRQHREPAGTIFQRGGVRGLGVHILFDASGKGP